MRAIGTGNPQGKPLSSPRATYVSTKAHPSSATKPSFGGATQTSATVQSKFASYRALVIGR